MTFGCIFKRVAARSQPALAPPGFFRENSDRPGGQ